MQAATRLRLAVVLVLSTPLSSSSVCAQTAVGSPFGTPVRLDDDWSVSATREAAAEWLSRHPNALQGARGALLGFTLRFVGKGADALSLAINYSDPTKSDITVACGGQAINPYKASSHAGGRTPEFGQLGGIKLPDGRTFAVLTGPEIVLTVFFDAPTACATGTPPLSLAFELADWDEARRAHGARKRHTLRFTPDKPSDSQS